MRGGRSWCVAALALLAVQLPAQEQAGADVSGNWGIDFPTVYFFRGIVQETHGVIAQPYVEFTYGLFDGEDTLEALDLTYGLWNSLHDGPTGSRGPGQTIWYESDLYAGLHASISGGLTVGAVYTAYTSPNGSFSTVQEIALQASFDDSSLWGDEFGGLQPSVMLAFELDSNQADGGANRGSYLQLGIEPSMTVLEKKNLSVSIPLTLGLSVDDYYEDATGDNSFGYLDLGVVADMPLSLVPARLGPWNASLGFHALFLGDSNEALNNGDDFEFIVSLGFSTSF